MASTAVTSPSPAPERLSLDSIPNVDLHLLTQSELTALSLISSTTFEDVVIPQIDTSVFNESAGSRKQTYSRLRPDLSGAKTRLEPLDSERAENFRIISLFKDLFYTGVEGERKRKRGRKPKFETDNRLALTVVVPAPERAKYEVARGDCEVSEELDKGLVNKNGVAVNLVELGQMEDPFAAELRRRTEGLTKVDELLGFVTELKGQWGSTRKKRKIIDANEFGDFLPNGWKVLVALKKRAGLAWVFCRRYISPAGRFFVSCKEVSSYLLSLTSPHDLRLQSTVQYNVEPVIKNKTASGNVLGVGAGIAAPSLYVASQCNDYENQQKRTCTTETIDNGKQIVLSKNVHLVELKAGPSLNCHKCSSPFSGKDKLLNHLLSCHKRKRRKSGEPIQDDVLMKDGKYECQFCERAFHERASYFGHVGNHVKSYARSMAGSPSVTTKQNPWDLVSVSGVPSTFSDTPVSVAVNRESGAGTPNIQAGSEPNLTSVDSKLNVCFDGETHSENCDDEKNKLVLHSEVSMEATLNRDEPSLCAGDGKMSSNTVKTDVCQSYAEINTKESEEPGVSGSGAVPQGGSELCVPVDSTNKSSPSSDDDLFDAYVGNKYLEPSFRDDEMEARNNDELMDATIGIEHTNNLEECSGVSRKEEKTGANKIEFMESTFADSKVERNSETCPLSEGHFDVEYVFSGLENETEVDLSSLGKGEVHCIDQEIQTETTGLLSSKNDDRNYIQDNSLKVPAVNGMGPQGTGASRDKLSNRVSAEPKCAAVENSSNLFFTCGSTDTPLEPEVIAKNEQEKISLTCLCVPPSGSIKTHGDISDVVGSYDNFVDDKQKQDPKKIMPGLSNNEHIHEDTAVSITNSSAAMTTMKLPEKDERLQQSNKLFLDFGSMSELNARFTNANEHETVHEGSSPFSLWGEQICVEDDQTRVSNNNSLNLFGLQQSCDMGYNLNKACMNEQRFAVQHNETGFFNRSNEGGDVISRGNNLDSTGLQQQFDEAYNLNKPRLNQQSFGIQHNQPGAYSTSDETRRERVAYGNSLSLASVQQTCDTVYGLNKASPQQTRNPGYSLNKGYIAPVQGFTKLDGVESSRDNHLTIGFENSSTRPSQNAATEFVWRTTEGNIPPGVVDSSSSQGQSSVSFQAFDFLSDKGGNDDLYTGNEKFDMSGFEELRSGSVEPMEFSFLTQDSNTQLEDPKMMSSYNRDMDQGFGSTVWHQKGTSLPNMIGAQVVTTLCVWCGDEFHQDSLTCEIQTGSIGFLCPSCKARMSGQLL